MNFETFINEIKKYNEEETEEITKAYNLAYELHKGQKRQSGEEYITHPLNVAYILAQMQADKDTICAALLHDTLEDTNITKERISILFNETIANLVDGVTKISGMNYTKEEKDLANTRKIIASITEDVRIIIIKLADRLHNMRTLEYKTELKQRENSLETVRLYVPLAYFIGAYRIKSELEDLSFKYLVPETYQDIKIRQLQIEKETNSCLNEMSQIIKEELFKKNIECEIKTRTKNLYGIYKKLNSGKKISEIHDLLSLKIMVNSIDECYLSLGAIHKLYSPINYRFKDYISVPKTNMYQGLHSTVLGPDGRLVQTQTRTFDMDQIATFGLTAYWNINKGNARNKMQQDLTQKYQFYKSLEGIDKSFANDSEFLSRIDRELFSEKVYIYNTKGEILELPQGSSVIDFAYKEGTNIGNTLVAAFVNENPVALDYILKNNDRVRVITNEMSYGPRDEWLDKVVTNKARQAILTLKSN